MLTIRLAITREQRHTDSTDHAVVRRHDDGLVEYLRERSGDSVVVGGATLEEDDVADLAPAHNTVQIVERDGVGESGGKVADFSALQKLSGDVALHEDGAAFAKPSRAFGGKRQIRKFTFDGDAKF